jgi:opacity protein-like surface antigen
MKSLESRGFIFLIAFSVFFLLCIGLTSIFNSLFAQGVRATIHKNDKTSIQVVVTKIGVDAVEYRLWDQFETNGGAYGPLREILKKDIWKIEYEDGRSDTFDEFQEPVSPPVQQTPQQTQPMPQQPAQQQQVQTPQLVQQQPVQTYGPRKVYAPGEFIHQGLSIGGKLGVFIPTNYRYQDVYGPGFMWGMMFGYWKGRFGMEFDVRMTSDKKGTPYMYGSGFDASAERTMFPLTLTPYVNVFKQGDFELYLGVGPGIYLITEKVSRTSGGVTESVEGQISPWGFHGTFGARLGPFCLELTGFTVPIKKEKFTHVEIWEDTNAGGFFLSGVIRF